MMVTWNAFIGFAPAALAAWGLGAAAALNGRHKAARLFTCAGLLIFFTFVLLLWHSLERPPLRTMGETRLWYSLFLPLVALLVYERWRYRWILSFSFVLSMVFIMVNLLKPEIHDKSLMPALQSVWFAPHVIVYMFAYALLGAATLVALYRLVFPKRTTGGNEIEACDNLVTVGLSFMTIGMLMGALWAQEAWGSYWSWDPKETWAAVTWFVCLLYLHLRHAQPTRERCALWVVVATFVLLQMCWWGINLLPWARSSSLHVY